MREVRFVAACEALAESFEQAGRLDLATLCDRAAFWIEGGPRIEHLSLDEVVQACRESLVTGAAHTDPTEQIRQNLKRIEQRLDAVKKSEAIELAARLQAVAVLTEKLI